MALCWLVLIVWGYIVWKWNDLKRLLRKRDVRDVSGSAAIMWPAVYPEAMTPPDEPHCTIVFLGEIKDFEGFTKQDVIEAIESTMHEVYLWTEVLWLDWFGPEQNVPVLRVHHDYLNVYHTSITGELKARGIPFSDRFPQYVPHISITDEAALSGEWPEKILLAPVELWWGGEHIQIGNKVKRVITGG